MKLEGLRPGVSDILIYYPVGALHGLWLEIKRNKKYTASERNTHTWLAQEKFHENVKSVGYEAVFCYGFDDSRRIVADYLNNSPVIDRNLVKHP